MMLDLVQTGVPLLLIPAIQCKHAAQQVNLALLRDVAIRLAANFIPLVMEDERAVILPAERMVQRPLNMPPWCFGEGTSKLKFSP
jgi:hypothetical protein